MRAEEYLKDPCRASSLPFWKTEQLILPRGVTVIRDDLYTAERNGGTEEPYFKLVHRLETLCPPKLPDSFRIVPCEPEGFARHIRECYAEEGVNADELRACARRPVYDPELWIAVEDETNGRIAASGIADLDTSIGEGILEWIQVSPEYRRRGFGYALQTHYIMKTMENGDIPFGQVEKDNLNSLKLQQKIGMTRSENLIVWMWK